MSSTFRIVPLIPGLVNEVVLEIFLHFVAIDRDGPSTLVLVCTAWRDAVLGSKFLQSLRCRRRRPNPALGENRDKLEEGICIVSFDGGGPGSMSQLRILEEFMARLAFKEEVEVGELLPADYFDLMGGVGFGGLVALLLGRLRMTTSQAMEELAKIGTATFPEGQDMATPEVNIVGLRKALESMLERNGHSVGMKLRDTSDSRCKVVLFAAATEVMDHCHPFRTYRSPRKSLECTFVDAACATVANPEYFPSVSIGPRLRKQNFAGIPHNFHNPMREVLKEAKLVFGEKTPVSLTLSLGAGQLARHCSMDHQVTRRSLIHCDSVARDLQDQLHGFAEYLRLNVDKGTENIELDNWHELGSIETYTNVYLEMNQITTYIDRAVQLLLQRNGSVTLGNLSGTSADFVVKFHTESLEKYLAMEFKQMQDVIQELGIEKVTLVDAIGNDIPIPKHFCPTYAMLSDVIKLYFQHQKPPGSDLVERGDYRLLHGSGRSTLDPVEWDQLEKVRVRVEMSMILRTRNSDKARCPRCRTRSEAPSTNGWATCASCSGQFQIEDQLLEYEVQAGNDSRNEEVRAEENSIVTPAVRESVQTSQGGSPIKGNKKIAKEEELNFRLISVVNLLDTLSVREVRLPILEKQTDSQAAENKILREILTRLQQENLQLKQDQFNFTFQQPLASTSTNTGVGDHQAKSLWSQSPLNDNPLTRMVSNSGKLTAANANRVNVSTPQVTSNFVSPSELNLPGTFGLDGGLEDKVSVLEKKMDNQAAENENLRELLSSLQRENMQLKQIQFNSQSINMLNQHQLLQQYQQQMRYMVGKPAPAGTGLATLDDKIYEEMILSSIGIPSTLPVELDDENLISTPNPFKNMMDSQMTMNSATPAHPPSNFPFIPDASEGEPSRERRKYKEIERRYQCGWNGCTKAYGTLNHLNDHVSLQGHGTKRHESEFSTRSTNPFEDTDSQMTMSSATPSHPPSNFPFTPEAPEGEPRRERRKYKEIERRYQCGWNGCTKAYGTLNHLNDHVSLQGHGTKRRGSEFS